MIDYENGKYISRFAFWNPATWSIPALYWDTMSQEQRYHAICRQLSKIIQYADYLGINVDDIAGRLEAIEKGELNDFIVATIEQWFEDNEPAIVSALEALNDALPISAFDDVNTVKKYIDDADTVLDGKIDGLGDLLPDSSFTSVNTVKKYIDDSIANVNTNTSALELQEWARLRYGGDGTMVFDIQNVHSDLTLLTTHNFISRDKKTNNMYFDVMIRNESENSVASGQHLFEIPYFVSPAYISLALQVQALIYKFDASEPVSDTTNRILTGITPARCYLRKDSGKSYITCNFALPANCEFYLFGICPDSNVLNWNNASFYDADLQNDVCDYFLNGDGLTSWEGTFEYSNNNDYRTDPQYLKTDCSGMTYIAFSHFGFHPQNSIEDSYLNDGIFVSYAPAGEKLDLSNARPGDLICYQDASANPDSRSSWTHVTIYAGDNKTYEMALYYPEAETEAGHIDGYGPYEITTPADEYRMTTEVNSITGRTNYGRNRCVVRFM